MSVHSTISIASVPSPASAPITTPAKPTSSPPQSNAPELWTPPKYVARVRAALGGSISLDAFSCAGANLTVRASRFFAKGDQTFRKSWRAYAAFLHPPSEAKFLNKIPTKFLKEWSGCNIKHAIILLDLPPKGYCYRVLAPRADAVCWTRHPIKFRTPSGQTQTSGNQQAFLYFGPDPSIFQQVFANVGKVRVIKQNPPRPPRPAASPDRRSNDARPPGRRFPAKPRPGKIHSGGNLPTSGAGQGSESGNRKLPHR